jgi:hypothetical protein
MNESLFRGLNERLEERAVERGARSTFDIVCECAREECTERITIGIADYEAVRADATTFIVVPGHIEPDVERVVSSHDGYDVVAKIGEAAVVAEIENPRDGQGPAHGTAGG